MKKSILLSVLFLGTFYSTTVLAQVRLKIKYPKCELQSETIFNDVKKYKTFTIENEVDFAKYFKLQEGEKIDFEKNLVLAGLIGSGNEDKFIEINAATYDPKAKYLNVRFDIEDTKKEDNGKFCVAVVPKSFNFKKVVFLKGKMYNWSQSGE